ncbi:TAP-like protein [Herbihabitans rhizosphaerae]|uniref:TAP-like protein n=1 Tax=Herbihabitans rhizosphaerae TaxID=1872711 RepID=A0A4Q7L210_9PSEU|nr:alpha/beta hydrolase [Herbihabitans rhizosphaerae]RZS43237.1 TAP-like protein [Herbihabitans rhizosphaerae]
MSIRSRFRLRNIAAVTALVAAATMIIVLPQSSAAQPGSAPPPITWGECTEADLAPIPQPDRARFTCGSQVVPLDHERPEHGTINIALMRRAASKPYAKIGSLFINPGGPGGPGFHFAWIAEQFLQPEVLDRFDVIGFDPRGVGRSTPLRCFATQEDSDAVRGRMAQLPITDAEERSTVDATRDFGRFCERFAGPLIEHMSTEAVARDLDLLRAGVGDRRLNYVGLSYGTLLGATYANMFPDKARAMLLDGNVDPTLRTLDGLEYDRQRTNGFEIALDAMLTRCDQAGPACAFSDGDPRARYDEIRRHLRDVGPITIPGHTVDLGLFVSGSAGALYRSADLAGFAKKLKALRDAIQPAERRVPLTAADVADLARFARLGQLDTHPDTPYSGDDSGSAVNCTDKPFNHRPQELPRIADTWDRQMPRFGRYLAWNDPRACSAWPLRDPDAYRGPWNRRTPNPVMLVGSYYDPATQYDFSKRMASQLGNAFLVSMDAFGHTAVGTSGCLDKIATRYLVDLRAPGSGTVCHPNTQPFPGS